MKEKQKKKNLLKLKFERLACSCPWRSYLKCGPLVAGQRRNNGCEFGNCAIMHFRRLNNGNNNICKR